MDYKCVGKYSSDRELPSILSARRGTSSDRDVLIRDKGITLHFVEKGFSLPYTFRDTHIYFGSERVLVGNNHKDVHINSKYVFISYPGRLEFLDYTGKRIKELSGEFVYRNGRFLQTEGLPYVVDFSGNTVFVPKIQKGILDFSEDGTLAYCSSPSEPENNFLVIDSLQQKPRVFERKTEEILRVCDISLYHGQARIENPHYAVSFFAGSDRTSLCHVVLSESCVWLICKKSISTKPVPARMQRVAISRMVVHDFLSEYTIWDLYLALATKHTLPVEPTPIAENFLLHMLVQRADTTTLIRSLFCSKDIEQSRRSTSLLCRAYRRTDDKGRSLLRKSIDFTSLRADDMYVIISYEQHLTNLFVKKCKLEKRLFYVNDLLEFAGRMEKKDEFVRCLLTNAILIYNYKGAEQLVEAEKEEIRAQKIIWLTEKYQYKS